MTTGDRSWPVALTMRLASENQQHSGRPEENGPRHGAAYIFVSSLFSYRLHNSFLNLPLLLF